MKRIHLYSFALLVPLATAALVVAACDTETPTTVVVDNAYPAPPDGGDPAQQTVVYRAWWVATYFPAAVAGATSSDEFRSVPASDIAYAVLAPGWDPASTTPPTKLVVVKSKAPLSAVRGDLLHIGVSDQTFTGNCAAQAPLSQADADFITQSIFPGEFANVVYDPATCTTTPIPSNEAGVDGGTDAADGGLGEGGADAGPG